MATRPNTLNSTTVSSEDVINPILTEVGNDTGVSFSSVKTVEDLQAVGNMFQSNAKLGDAFVNTLMNRIVFEVFKSLTFNNPLKTFKKGYVDIGFSIEEIFIELAKGHVYSAEKAEETVFKRTPPKTLVEMHTVNYKTTYPVTIQRNSLRKAFLSFANLDAFIAQIIESVYKGADYDEYLAMCYMLGRQLLNGKINTLNVGELNSSTSNGIVSKIKRVVNDFGFPTTKYNASAVLNSVRKDNLSIIETAEFSAVTDVEVLAKAFNIEYVKFLGRQVMINDFADMQFSRLNEIFEDVDNFVPFTTAEIALLQKVYCFVLDSDYFMVYDQYVEMGSIYNPKGMYWNYDLNIGKILSVSPFSNISAIVGFDKGSVTAITLSADNLSVVIGGSEQITATYTGTGEYEELPVYTVTGNTSALTTVDFNGILRVGENETATSIKVKATQDAITSNELTFTITKE